MDIHAHLTRQRTLLQRARLAALPAITRPPAFYPIGNLNAGNYTQVAALSGNGLVVVGLAAEGDEFYQPRAFRWSWASGFESLGALNGGAYSSAEALASDGQGLSALRKTAPVAVPTGRFAGPARRACTASVC